MVTIPWFHHSIKHGKKCQLILWISNFEYWKSISSIRNLLSIDRIQWPLLGQLRTVRLPQSKASRSTFCACSGELPHPAQICWTFISHRYVPQLNMPACSVWHTGLTVEESDSVEAIQKRAMKIIYLDVTYAEARGVAGLERMDARRESLARVVVLCSVFLPKDSLSTSQTQPLTSWASYAWIWVEADERISPSNSAYS